MKRILTILLLAATLTSWAAEKPRLVVQIVVGSMRVGDLERYEAQFCEGGFRRLMHNSRYYKEAAYLFQQTTTPATLSTLATGANPSMHGIVGTSWQDYTTNLAVDLIDGRHGPGGYHLVVPTLSDALQRQHPTAHTVSLALDAEAAILLGGRTNNVYWVEPETAEWGSSLYYTQSIPEWLAQGNREGFNIAYLLPYWQQLLHQEQYLNTRSFDIRKNTGAKRSVPAEGLRRLTPRSYIERLRYTPAGNTAVLAFAKQAIAQHHMGTDEVPDLINIYLDTPRYLSEVYGPESIEVEDMYYRLDRDLSDFLTFLYAQVKPEECIVVLTSDHGTSHSFDLDAEHPAERFNAHQFRVIANGFLNVRYGSGHWVLGFQNQALYLNHTLIYERNLDLARLQNELAIFALQFSGVSHAMAASDLRSAYFADGYAHRMQNSFYARRSGDVLLNLMPGLIIEEEGRCSASGSMYGYDAEVPLLISGGGITPGHHHEPIDMTSLAPTVAQLLGIHEPDAAEGRPLDL
ncbi:MAG: alkaline phosphatase family protein [Alistipes sp.]|nr:alkaline phosphatase family protein [Alistipes sp.]